MLIDSHLHIGLNNWTEEYLIRYLDVNRIDKAWILTWEESHPIVPHYYQSLDIEMVKKAFKDHPDRIVPFYAPDPGRPLWKDDLKRCLDEGFAGCAELKVSYRWNDPRMISLLEFLNENKLPLIFHMEREREIFIPEEDRGIGFLLKRLINERYNGRSARMIYKTSRATGFMKKYIEKRTIHFPGYLLDFDTLETSVTDYPDVKFIGHGPHIWNHFSEQENDHLFHQDGKPAGKGATWKMLELHENFYCDLSGFSGYNALKRDPSVSKKLLSSCSSKLLFGTDNMGFGLFSLIESLGLEKDQTDRIYAGNAMSVLG